MAAMLRHSMRLALALTTLVLIGVAMDGAAYLYQSTNGF